MFCVEQRFRGGLCTHLSFDLARQLVCGTDSRKRQRMHAAAINDRLYLIKGERTSLTFAWHNVECLRAGNPIVVFSDK